MITDEKDPNGVWMYSTEQRFRLFLDGEITREEFLNTDVDYSVQQMGNTKLIVAINRKASANVE
jgi:hypothetical protein